MNDSGPGNDQSPSHSGQLQNSNLSAHGSKVPKGDHKPMSEVSNHVSKEHRTSSGSTSNTKSSSKEHHHGHPKENSVHKSSKEHSSSKHHSDKSSKEHKHKSSSKDGKSEKSSSKSNHHSSSSNKEGSSSSKPSKDVEDSKHKEKSSKHREGGEKSEKSSSSSSHKSKNSSGDHHSSSSKHSSGEKHHKSSKDKDKHHHSSSSSSNKKVQSSHDNKIKIKIEKTPETKVKTEKTSETKIKSEKIPETKIKTEKINDTASVTPSAAPAVVKNHIKESPSKVKSESFSEDDTPLSARTQVKKEKMKRELDESDDEPLTSRIEKKQKTSNKKRKTEDDSDEDFQTQPVKKHKKDQANNKTKQATNDASPVVSPTKKRGAKAKEEAEEVWKWWEEKKQDDGCKWRTLQHYGPVFAPPYEPIPKSVKFFYDGKEMRLSPEAEEVAGFYARMIEHDYSTKDVFNNNFMKDWKKVMTAKEKEILTDLSKCNFSQINDYYKLKSEERKAMTKEQKLAIKKENEELAEKYGFCVIDSHKQKIGNFRIEPPGLFRGRGEHPKMGMLKRRIMPENVIINIGKEATKPEAPKGHKWKEVRHDNSVTWLACWTENILGQNKYIMLNPSSKIKGEKDFNKYETARKLKTKAPKIREEYQRDWKSKEMKVRQRAVALYFIDQLALRAGNEKEEGETADTVGCCSLRVEHITLDEKKDGKECVVTFDFLGKDSIRYINSVPVEKRVFKNLKLFMENKQQGDDLFDRLNTSILNKYLNDLMEGLTAKVFRTFNASKTLQEQLDLLTKEDMSMPERLLTYNRANRAVAILCNHQRTVPKTFDKQMENMQKKMDEKEEQIAECKKEYKQVKKDGNRTLIEKKKKRLSQLEEQLKKLEVQTTDKEENKQIALGTSKLNYLDPRISVAWCKKWDVPIEKIYNRTQRDKFRWAIEMATPDYKF